MLTNAGRWIASWKGAIPTTSEKMRVEGPNFVLAFKSKKSKISFDEKL